MKALNTISRFLAPSALAIALGVGFAMPVPQAQAQDDLARVLVDIADVVFQSGVPYYRYGDYGRYDRLVVQRDRYGRPVYYRYVPRHYDGRRGPPYGNAYGYWRNGPGSWNNNVSCNKHGKCKAIHYNGRYDRRWDRDRDHDHDRGWWDGRRWHDDD
jgi:hypothetical protein